MSNYWKTYDYNTALESALKEVPENIISDTRFEVPKVVANIEGNRTLFQNFKDIAIALSRKQEHLLKFITSELGTNGNFEGNRAIFQGNHSRNMIQNALNRYANSYVFCATCGKPDTRFEFSDRIRILSCDACGASQAVK